jgi:hypothetical protein
LSSSSYNQKSIDNISPPPKSPQKYRKSPTPVQDSDDSALDADMKLKFQEEDESASFELESNSSAMSDEDGMKVVQDLTNQKKKRKRVRKKSSKQGSMIKNFRSSKSKFKKK